MDKDIIKKLETYEEFASIYSQLDEASTSVSWTKADLLLEMVNKLGDASINSLSADIKQPKSTIASYIRTARAFPYDKRNPIASFSLHFQASYADKYNDKTGEFEGEKRFEWVNQAIDSHMSTRQLAERIQVDKNKEDQDVKFLPCVFCDDEGETKRFVFYAPNTKRQAVRFDLHDECYLKIMDIIYGRKLSKTDNGT